MKLKSFWAAVAATLLLGLFSSSCAPKEEEVEEPTLTVTTEAVTVPNAGGASQAITITTNQTGWQAIAGADWISTTQSGNNLTITALPNPLTTDRKAEVLVTAGSAIAKKITVIQTAADIVLDVAPESIVVSNQGGTKLVTVNTNVNDWDVALAEDADWITITRGSDLIVLEIAANEGDARETKLYASKGSTAKEITITQAGVSVNIFHTPLFIGEASIPTVQEILAYEASVGSFLISYSEETAGFPPFLPATGDVLEFFTSSKYLPKVSYRYNYVKKHLEFITYFTQLTYDKFVKTGYLNFLKDDLGFDLEEKENYAFGENKTTGFKVLVTTSNGLAAVEFTGPNPPDPEQPAPMPTFDELPLINMMPHLYIYNKRDGWNIDKVTEWETANKGTLSSDKLKKDKEGNVRYAFFNVDDPKPTARNYWFLSLDESDDENNDHRARHLGQLKHIGYIGDYKEYVFWEDERGRKFLTKEFKEKMAAEGFELIAEQDPFYWFTDKKNVVYGWQVITYEDFADQKEVVNAQAYIDESVGASKFMLQSEKDAMLKRWAEKMKN